MAQLADQANAYAVMIQTMIAQGSLDAAEQALNNPFAIAILPTETRQNILIQISKQKKQFAVASAQKRIKIKFWIIFIILGAVCGYLIYHHGLMSKALNMLGVITRCARFIIGTLLTGLIATLAAGISYLLNVATTALGIFC